MKFVLAPDSFKESMTAKEVAYAMERGIKKVLKNAECMKVPMADGGEGTVQSLVDATNGQIVHAEVTSPDGKNKVDAVFGILGDHKTAVIEMSSASGIHLIESEKRNPLYTTTYGTGELIKAALDKDISTILIGIGGSATNDGGAGMVAALGAKLLDKDKNEVPFGGGNLNKLQEIDLKKLDERLKNVNIRVACDVDNPLLGEKGASYIFGPQKGATPEIAKKLDKNLASFANIIENKLGKDIKEIPGAGAAGGLGFGLMAFLNAKLEKGIDIVIEYTKLREKVKSADFVFTGEGSIDFQTIFGKTPFGVAKVAKEFNIPVIAFAAHVGDDVDILYENGIDSIVGILRGVTDLKSALKEGKINVEKASENITRILTVARRY
ncbi:glycerate kinase [Clostridium botulinum]|uniref:glycerate kinase family protein n=1 Tax=Clostridium botulinum TaxID=1491 RepID=UPI000585ED63|nr:glycerate kinase [Clostridium botulinum]AJD27148.1 glycerate kinase family protein [Clostridium botulinum CDC_297]MBY6876945.1 glycerate kinase [Clostridium botulinum]MBY6891089.1 glycerate kinase [Clostridium botulinum]MBY6894546.1 glycerate kinase [Clostridium botulinum]MBY6901562.1 glycerate kinase [Clostridium botulinum]